MCRIPASTVVIGLLFVAVTSLAELPKKVGSCADVWPDNSSVRGDLTKDSGMTGEFFQDLGQKLSNVHVRSAIGPLQRCFEQVKSEVVDGVSLAVATVQERGVSRTGDYLAKQTVSLVDALGIQPALAELENPDRAGKFKLGSTGGPVKFKQMWEAEPASATNY